MASLDGLLESSFQSDPVEIGLGRFGHRCLPGQGLCRVGQEIAQMDYFYASLGQKAGASGAVGNDQIITSLKFAECAPFPGHVRIDRIDRTSFPAADGMLSGMSHLAHLQLKAKQDRPHCLLCLLVITQGAWVVHGNPAMWNDKRG